MVAGFLDDADVGKARFSALAGGGKADEGDVSRSVGTMMNEIPRLAPKKIADEVMPRTPPTITVFDVEDMLEQKCIGF